jgi:(2Fe-2S) ferredoxin
MTMSATEFRVCYVCVNVNCARAGSEALRDALAEKLAGTSVEVRTQLCFGACWAGPNIVVFPGAVCYANVQLRDLETIVARILEDVEATG